MIVSYLGTYAPYTPDAEHPSDLVRHGLSIGATFKRNEFGDDWYLGQYGRVNGSMLFAVDADSRVTTVGFGPDGLWPPSGQKVYEMVPDAIPASIEASGYLDWMGHTFDPAVGSFTPPPPPPPHLTRRQLRLGLLTNGITTAQVEAVISAIPDAIDRETAQIEWDDASTYERSHPLVDQIGAAMSLTPEQIDTMWAAASTL